jgi:hypothetical protein
MITENTFIVAAGGIESADLDGEVVLLDVNSGLYYGLSTVGARILELIREPASVRSLIETLRREYTVDAQRLLQDVISFLVDMESRRLIRVLNGEVA